MEAVTETDSKVHRSVIVSYFRITGLQATINSVNLKAGRFYGFGDLRLDRRSALSVVRDRS